MMEALGREGDELPLLLRSDTLTKRLLGPVLFVNKKQLLDYFLSFR